MLSSFPSRLPPKLMDELRIWLNEHRFSHFVTLATNDPGLADRIERLNTLVKGWDARMNRALIGPAWQKPVYRHERMFAFYFLEKPRTNPHWHALIRIDEEDPDKRIEKHHRIRKLAEEKWTKLIPSGSVKVQPIYEHEDVVKYVAKELGYAVSFEHFVVPDQFENG